MKIHPFKEKILEKQKVLLSPLRRDRGVFIMKH